MEDKDRKIYFGWDGASYEVSMLAYHHNTILLPDDRVLVANGWFESYPPQPAGLKEQHGLDITTLLRVFGPDIRAALVKEAPEQEYVEFVFEGSLWRVEKPKEAVKTYVLPDSRVLAIIWNEGYGETLVARVIDAEELAIELHTEVANCVKKLPVRRFFCFPYHGVEYIGEYPKQVPEPYIVLHDKVLHYADWTEVCTKSEGDEEFVILAFSSLEEIQMVDGFQEKSIDERVDAIGGVFAIERTKYESYQNYKGKD